MRPEPPERAQDALTPPPPRARFQRTIHIEEPELTGPHNLRVTGDPGFYHLTFPDPDSDQSCDDPQAGEDGEQSDEGQEGDEDLENNQEEDGEQDDAEQDGEESEEEPAPEEQGGDEERDADQDRPQGDQQDDSEQSDEEASAQQTSGDASSTLGEPDQTSEEDAARERLRRLLESLAAEEDRNLQLEHALENMSPIRVEQQW